MTRLAGLLATALVGLLIAAPIAGLVAAMARVEEAAARLRAAGLLPGEPPPVMPVVWDTVLLAVLVTAAALLVGTMLAYSEHRLRLPLGRVLATVALLPLAVPSYVLAGAVQRSLGPAGLVGEPLGVSDRFEGFWAAVLVLTIICTPYAQLLVGAVLARLPAEEEDAARSLGASPWRVFSQIVLPRLRPALAFAAVLCGLYAISDFGAVSVLNCRVLSWRIYQAQAGLDVGYAIQLGFGIAALVCPLLLVAALLRGPSRAGGVPNPRAAARRRPGILSTAGLMAIPLLLGLVGVGLPAIELIRWVVDAPPGTETGFDVAPAIWGSAKLSAIGATVIVALALVSAAATRRGRLGTVLDSSVFVAGALPGILVAFGLSLAALWLPQTVGLESVRAPLTTAGVLVVAGYATRYLSQGHGVVRSALLRLDPRQEEVARSLGASRLRTAVEVTLPHLTPALAAAWVLVLLALIKELPITLLLAPHDTDTLAYRVWERYSEAFLYDAGVAGLWLLAIALGVQLATLRWRRGL